MTAKDWKARWVQQGFGVGGTQPASDRLSRINSGYAPDRIDLRRDNSESALAFAEVLERMARRIRSGLSYEDAANELEPVVRLAMRRT